MTITALSITICRACFPKSAKSKFSENCWSNTCFSVGVPGLEFTRFLYVGVVGCIGAIVKLTPSLSPSSSEMTLTESFWLPRTILKKRAHSLSENLNSLRRSSWARRLAMRDFSSTIEFRYQSALRILGYDVEMCHSFMNSSMLSGVITL